jgi:hypothetical protein
MKMRNIIICFALLGSWAVLGGCASQGGSASTGVHAECTVCKENADLACIDITVDDRTPRTEHNGKTYYFCSDDCRKDFEKAPAKYAGK